MKLTANVMSLRTTHRCEVWSIPTRITVVHTRVGGRDFGSLAMFRDEWWAVVYTVMNTEVYIPTNELLYTIKYLSKM